MTDSIKKLFDAPWEADKFVYYHPSGIGEVNIRVKSSKNELVAGYVTTIETANRIVHLPELYDALVEAVNDACQDCVDETYERTGMLFDPANDGCIYPERDCCPKCRSWITLLEKVRNGK